MISSVQLNRNYAIYLSDVYGGTKNNVQVVGITSIDSLAKNNPDYNIYQTYFEPYGLGLSTYYTAIQTETVIYICVPITSLEPFNIDIDNKIYIPESIINLDKSSEYVKAYNINLNIYPIIKNFDTDDERDKYIEGIKEKVKNRLTALIDFNSLGLEIDSSYAPIYLTTEDITEINKERSDMYQEYIDRVNKYNRSREESANSINNAIKEANEAKIAYEEAKSVEEAKVAELQRLIEIYENYIKTHQ